LAMWAVARHRLGHLNRPPWPIGRHGRRRLAT
jgi:hypothetical protein